MKKTSFFNVVGAFACALWSIRTLGFLFDKIFQKNGVRELAGRVALSFPGVKEKINKKIAEEAGRFQESIRKKWEPFGELYVKIPWEGLSFKEVVAKLETYSRITREELKKSHISGTLYGNSFKEDFKSSLKSPEELDLNKNWLGGETPNYALLDRQLQYLAALAADHTAYWNTLHAHEFAAAKCIEYQVGAMITSLHGGDPKEVITFQTSGGTGSLMTAMRGYREWGAQIRGIPKDKSIILAGESVHAAILKAGDTYLMNVIPVKENSEGKMDPRALEKLLQQHKDLVVSVVANEPNYPYGTFDHLEDIGKITKRYGVGLHADGCLGGFLSPYLEENQILAFKCDSVTSFSCDTHKYGYGMKGASTLAVRTIKTPYHDPYHLAMFIAYVIFTLKMGAYVTSSEAGSQSCTASVHAWMVMLLMGRKAYTLVASKIFEITKNLKKSLDVYQGEIRVLNDPEANIVAFDIDPALGLMEGATYALSEAMEKHGCTLNDIQDKVHFCVTLRCVADPRFISHFCNALDTSLKEVKKQNEDLKLKNQSFPGKAKLYCAVATAHNPLAEKRSLGAYAENWLFGLLALRKVAIAYVLAQLNPYSDPEIIVKI